MPRCRFCRELYKPSRPMQPSRCCDAFECKAAFVSEHVRKARVKRQKEEAKAEKEARKAIRQAKDKLKTRRDYVREAQTAFNAYIRERDKDKPCICCGLLLSTDHDSTGGSFDCGHYRSVGSAPHLRFDERNAHGQRKQCNRYGAGRAVDYRIGLINRIGYAAVDQIESDNEPRKWTIEQLKEIKATYVRKLKELRAQRAIVEVA